jgi:hypothetical protein
MITNNFPDAIEQKYCEHSTQNQSEDDDDDNNMLRLSSRFGLLEKETKSSGRFKYPKKKSTKSYMALWSLLILIETTIPSLVARQILVDASSVIAIKLVITTKAFCD